MKETTDWGSDKRFWIKLKLPERIKFFASLLILLRGVTEGLMGSTSRDYTRWVARGSEARDISSDGNDTKRGVHGWGVSHES